MRPDGAPLDGSGDQISPTALDIDYALINFNQDIGFGVAQSYYTRHVNDDGIGGYTWAMNETFALNAQAHQAFNNAFETWRCNTTGIYWTETNNTPIDATAIDGTNIIHWDTNAPVNAGVLGVCTSYYGVCGAANSQNVEIYVNELDITFNDDFINGFMGITWNYGPRNAANNQVDFESVSTHELGHGHQLTHVIALVN